MDAQTKKLQFCETRIKIWNLCQALGARFISFGSPNHPAVPSCAPLRHCSSFFSQPITHGKLWVYSVENAVKLRLSPARKTIAAALLYARHATKQTEKYGTEWRMEEYFVIFPKINHFNPLIVCVAAKVYFVSPDMCAIRRSPLAYLIFVLTFIGRPPLHCFPYFVCRNAGTENHKNVICLTMLYRWCNKVINQICESFRKWTVEHGWMSNAVETSKSPHSCARESQGEKVLNDKSLWRNSVQHPGTHFRFHLHTVTQ